MFYLFFFQGFNVIFQDEVYINHYSTKNYGSEERWKARDLSFGVNQLEKLADTAKVLVEAASNSMELDTVSMM